MFHRESQQNIYILVDNQINVIVLINLLSFVYFIVFLKY